VRSLALALGIILLLADLADVIRALVVPRPHTRGPLPLVISGLRRSLQVVARRVRSFPRRDALLTIGESVLVLGRLVLWLALGLLGFGAIIFGSGHQAIGAALVASGSSIFTLGFADAPGTIPAAEAFLAAAFGLVVVALQIAYLPALYDAFNRRETLVTMLESRAGTPAWGPELLARHYLVGIQANLPSLYEQWERWAADVAESHTTYPTLLHFRSPHRTNSWVIALASVLDSAALVLALTPSAAPTEARLCLRMGFTALRDIARVHRIPFDPDPDPDGPLGLPFTSFATAVEHLADAGVPLERSAEEAWPDFRGWRVNYESTVHAVADLVMAPAAPWTGARRGDPEEPPAPRRPRDRRPESRVGPPPGPEPGPSDQGIAGGVVPPADHRHLPLPSQDADRRRGEHERRT
jgi:hypothetical protein